MAQIKMDVSEYEEMKENTKLLKESLKREKEQSSKIEKLRKEKIKALKDAKMQVVKISRNETTEHALIKKSGARIWNRLFDLITRGYRPGERPNVGMISNLDDDMMAYGLTTTELIDAFFEKSTSISTPGEPEITTIGLDEVKIEIREDIVSRIDEATKIELEQAKRLTEEFTDLKEELRIVNKERISAQKFGDKVSEDLKKAHKDIDSLVERFDEAKLRSIRYDEIKFILKDGYGRWNRAELLDRIINTIKHESKDY